MTASKRKAVQSKADEEVHTSTLRLPVSLWERVKHLAIDKRLSMAQVLVFAVEQYLDREEKS
jgi:hypothetical protein